MSVSNSLLTRLRKIFASERQLAEAELARKAIEEGAEQLRDCSVRSKATVRGTIESVTIDKPGGWFEARINDGTGSATVVWMGRRAIPGIVAGRNIKVTGRLSSRGDSKVIYNPEYELLS